MMRIEFRALVKEVKAKALVSLDKGYEIRLQGDEKMADLFKAPADREVTFMAEWNEK